MVVRTGEPADPQEQRKRLFSIAGKYDSGLSDVSERHDNYLAEAFKHDSRRCRKHIHTLPPSP